MLPKEIYDKVDSHQKYKIDKFKPLKLLNMLDKVYLFALEEKFLKAKNNSMNLE